MIWDRLSEAGLTGRYYFQERPFLALWGQKYLTISRHYRSFLLACARAGFRMSRMWTHASSKN